MQPFFSKSSTMETKMSLSQVTFLLFFGFQLALVAAEEGSVVQYTVLPMEICPVLSCGSINMTITFLKKDLTKIKVDLANIHLIDPTCKGFAKNETIYIQSPTKVGECGTIVIVNDTHAVYKNNIFLKPDPLAIIYREEYRVNFSCIYPLDMDVSLGTVLNPIMSIIEINIAGRGLFKVKMAVYKDPAYIIPRQEGDILSTKDKLYVGVNITEGDTSNFHLVLKNCFATPTQNFYGTLKYDIIKNRCKNENDKTIHVAANGIASFGQFSIQAFKFIGGHGQIFLHCQVHLCNYKSSSCVPVCNTGNGADGSPQDDDSNISLGAITITDPEQLCTSLNCGASYINVTFKKDDIVEANVDIQKLQINEQNCHDVIDDGKTLSIGWPLGKCGTTLTTNASHAIYRNSIYLAPNPSQIIYRQEYYINISCIYPLDMNVSLQNFLNPMISTYYIMLEGFGNFEVVMAAFKDVSYKELYEGGEIKISTKDKLFVGVFISKGDTKQFDLVVQQCHATPTNNPQDAKKYDIILDSCPNEEDGTIQIYSNGISSQGQFSFQMFQFINYNYVFLHCKVHLCSKSGICIPVCPKPNIRSAAPQGYTLSLGPFTRTDPINYATAQTTTKNIADPTTKATITTAKNIAGKMTYLDLSTLLAVLLFTFIM